MITIKELTQTVGCGVTPRMVRHYHQIGLLPQPARSNSNYRLYSKTDVQSLQRIMALKQQGFQLSHIRAKQRCDRFWIILNPAPYLLLPRRRNQASHSRSASVCHC